MRLSTLRVSRLVFGLTFLFAAIPAFCQFEEMADVNADSAATARLVAKSPYVVVNITEKDLAERLGQMSSCLDLRPTKVVVSYINHYLYRPEKTKKILSRRLTYFPIFEEQLRAEGVPDALKYLSVVESALNPNAVSRVGASGLWQFMPSTGTDYGMQINSAVDERNNVVKSSESAARYLKHLYNQYNDWALALAAYNSGPTRVNSAIRRAGSKNFWIIQRYLPSETRNYVPAFIAATYICNFFTEHNLQPDYPELDAQILDHIVVYDGISFSAIAKATGLEYSTVEELNPGFKRAYIPPSKRGYYVTVPKRVMPSLVKHLNGLGGNTYRVDANEYSTPSDAPGGTSYYCTTVTVKETQLADQFALQVGSNGAQLRAWNNLPNPYVYANQTVKIWHPVHALRHTAEKIEAPAATPANKRPESPVPVSPNVTAHAGPAGMASAPAATSAAKPLTIIKKSSEPQKQYLFHKVKDKETLSDISHRYGVSVDALMMMNNTSEIKSGMLLRIKELK